MSTTYTGDPTATQAPGPLPALGTAPILTLPSDGEGASVSSIVQAHKESADFIAYLNSFERDADAETWPRIHDTWRQLINVAPSTSTTNLAANPAWDVFTTANASIGNDAPTTALAFPRLAFDPGSADTNEVRMFSAINLFLPTTTSIFVAQWDFALLTSAANIDWNIGLSSDTTWPGDTAAHAMRFESYAGGNWSLLTGAGGAVTYTTAGTPVAPTVGTFQRFKVRYDGSATTFGAGAAKARFYINGALYATVTATMPTAAMKFIINGYSDDAPPTTGTGSLGPVSMMWKR